MGLVRRRTLRCAAVLGLVGCTTGGGGTEPLLDGAEALVFVSRAVAGPDGAHVVGASDRTVDFARYVPGGGVWVLEPATPSGRVRSLTAALEGVDVNGLDLSYDGRRVVFSMRHAGDPRWHLWLATLDGADLRQLTFGPHDDVKPTFLAGDRIVFLTTEPYTEMGTRFDEVEHLPDVTQPARVDADAGDASRRRCGQSLGHATDAFPLADGRFGYSRWEGLGDEDEITLFAARPDCTEVAGLAAEHGQPGHGLVQMQEAEPGVFVGVTTSLRGTVQAGALVRVDTRTLGPPPGLDEQVATVTPLTADVPIDDARPASGVGRYRTPRAVPGSPGTWLVSWANGDVNQRNALAGTAPDFGIYLLDVASGRRELLYDAPGTWEGFAIAVAPRATPPVLPDTVPAELDLTTPAVLGSIDVAVTSLEETVVGGPLDGLTLAEALRATHRMRIVEGYSAEVGPPGGVFGLTPYDGAAILGEVPVYADGSWEARVNPYLPVRLQPLDAYGLAIRALGTWIHGVPGEVRRCGGCHERRGPPVLPRSPGPTSAEQAGPADAMAPVAARIEIPWAGAAPGSRGSNPYANLQELFDARCAGCHGGAAASDPFAGRTYEVASPDGPVAVPWLDLGADPLTVRVGGATQTYPASYLTLLLPAALGPGGAGERPPVWVVPGVARQSRLIAKVNVPSEVEPGRWAFPTPPHPEDVGVALDAASRRLLVQMVDLGAQYYTRRNVPDAARWLAAGFDDG